MVTDRRIYHFMLQALQHTNKPSSSAAFGVRFHYPMEAAAATARAAQEQRARAALQQEERPANWNYWACGAKQLRPIEVYDDGRFTYMRFPGAQEIPAIFLINSDGTESLTNGQMRGNRYVVFATAAKFILRKGNACLLYTSNQSVEAQPHACVGNGWCRRGTCHRCCRGRCHAHATQDSGTLRCARG